MTDVDAYRSLFEALMRFEPPVYLFGGFAEDALLHGSVVRPHEDVDVLVSRDALERQLENARAIGFAFEEVRFQPSEGKPVVIGTGDGNINLEISVHDLTDEGGVCFFMVDERDRLVRIELSDGVFDHPTSQLDGVAVRTVSPLAQMQIREGIRMAGGFGPPRPKDIPVQQELIARFFPGVPVERLRPTVTDLTPS
jgi:hypothetical protein